ncbi:EscE/YscE/SsaE family type III secretion system needle protein co-chaperone [Parendozoicomonas haliclonae]|uniref:EscE/YscE/SsaE family type III secretion system needle protein co-chaperone n=1 Tax=Parendozoicomonas haliclonae TaxID=1960125 RepID=A0A1X7AEA4_9GAMM|nr:EscE/YscE/SsaE family type III secretion system needle protein co-chaperone [Parendozoicomonas haliclonae]SMA33869.1 hypothetical protein EHSB41UT_00337 [Parendozoicomonas haliclonae]
MADNDFVSLSVTEDRLSTDKDGKHKQQLLAQLNQDLDTVRKKRNSGLAPDEFACADALIDAIDDAIKVVELTWHKHHDNKKTH